MRFSLISDRGALIDARADRGRPLFLTASSKAGGLALAPAPAGALVYAVFWTRRFRFYGASVHAAASIGGACGPTRISRTTRISVGAMALSIANHARRCGRRRRSLMTFSAAAAAAIFVASIVIGTATMRAEHYAAELGTAAEANSVQDADALQAEGLIEEAIGWLRAGDAPQARLALSAALEIDPANAKALRLEEAIRENGGESR